MFIEEIMERMNKLNAPYLKDVVTSSEMTKEETVIGEMTDLQRKLYTVAWQYKDEFRQLKSTMLMIQARITNEESDERVATARMDRELASINQTMNLCQWKASAVMKILWVEIHKELDASIADSTGNMWIRAGNKITMSTTKAPDIPGFRFDISKGGQ